MLLLNLFRRILPKIAFVTDNTAYLPEEFIKIYNITVMPQVLIWGDHTNLDGGDIKPQVYYARLKTTKVIPTTSQISVVTTQTTFESLINKGNEVKGIFFSAKLFGTMQSDNRGRETLGASAGKVSLVDSYSTAIAMGFKS
jgi:DegV family protein with EDD domain